MDEEEKTLLLRAHLISGFLHTRLSTGKQSQPTALKYLICIQTSFPIGGEAIAEPDLPTVQLLISTLATYKTVDLHFQ